MEKKKTPRNYKKVYQASFGLLLTLLSLIILFNQLPTLQVSLAFLYVFGVFTYVLFSFLAGLGLFLMIKPFSPVVETKKKHKWSGEKWGIVVLSLGLIILFGLVFAPNYFKLVGFSQDFHGLYADYFNPYKAMEPLNIFTLNDGATRGGFLGTFLYTLFQFGTDNNTFPIIILVVLFLLAFLLIFNKPLLKGFRIFIAFVRREKKKSKEYKEISKLVPQEVRRDNIQAETSATPVIVALDERKESSVVHEEVTQQNSGMTKAKFGSNNTIVTNEAKPFFEEEIIIEEQSKAKGIPVTDDDFIVVEPTEEELLYEEELRREDEMRKTPVFEEEIEVIEEAPTPIKIEQPIVVPEPEPVKPKVVVEATKPYRYPSPDLLDEPQPDRNLELNIELANQRVEELNNVFTDLRVGAEAVSYTIGPSVTRYDIQYDAQVKTGAVRGIVLDISRRLGGVAARFEEIVPGRTTSGIEVENAKTSTVYFKDTLAQIPDDPKNKMSIPFGKNIDGKIIYAPLNEFPHMLIAGSSGSGKSVYLHSVLLPLVMRNSPADLRLLLIDPKKVEMTKYRDIPHLLCPIVTEPNEAKTALDRLVDEMERRYQLFGEYGVNSIISYNKKAAEAKAPQLARIVIVLDEFSDLMDATNRDVELPVKRLGQKSRAAGIHMIIATQRPTVKSITGDIKANITTRVALMAASQIDSITIIGQAGAEQLLGHGDMLVDSNVISRGGLVRLQGCYVSEDEVERVGDFIRAQGSPIYDPAFENLKPEEVILPEFSQAAGTINNDAQGDDVLYPQILEDAFSREYISISYIQTVYGIGFNRARRFYIRLQGDGVVEKYSSAKGSKVLIHNYDEYNRQLGEPTID